MYITIYTIERCTYAFELMRAFVPNDGTKAHTECVCVCLFPYRLYERSHLSCLVPAHPGSKLKVTLPRRHWTAVWSISRTFSINWKTNSFNSPLFNNEKSNQYEHIQFIRMLLLTLSHVQYGTVQLVTFHLSLVRCSVYAAHVQCHVHI